MVENADERRGITAMADITQNRPFDNFKTAITDPPYFFGRKALVDRILKFPYQVRVILGGRRFGKTSVLRATEWNFLSLQRDPISRAFPVLISLEVHQPKSLDNLRYIFIRELRSSIQRWKQVPFQGLQKTYRSFLGQIAEANLNIGSWLSVKIPNLDYEKRLSHDDFREALVKALKELQSMEFSGICFLLDEAEYIVRKEWANDAWSYLRGLKDTDTALKPFFGLILAGYRDVKEYDQKIGSPLLNIADIQWLKILSEESAKKLIAFRAEKENRNLGKIDFQTLLDSSGNHPFLLQQILNHLFDAHLDRISHFCDDFISDILRNPTIDNTFSSWWNDTGISDGFGEKERKIYQLMIKNPENTAEQLAKFANFSLAATEDAIDVLTGTGVTREKYGKYTICGSLLKRWIAKRH